MLSFLAYFNAELFKNCRLIFKIYSTIWKPYGKLITTFCRVPGLNSRKAEQQRIDAFELWCWRRLLRVPWTARRSNQSILEISPGISLEGMMLKPKLQYFGHLMRRADSLEKTLMLGGIGGRRRRDNRGWDGWMASPTRWTWVWVNSSSWWWTGRPGVLQFHGVAKSQTQLSDWTDWTELIEHGLCILNLFICFLLDFQHVHM